ncbi:PP2C family protein-serine/threonine phosphatase [Kitasatospora paranensis]|uniref:PP2C family protein-serine/threonine phosphatase n=1 Tax=Kitasatospora paranensis TaxID=258053 RepID=A0ABW2FRF4_9ACTN
MTDAQPRGLALSGAALSGAALPGAAATGAAALVGPAPTGLLPAGIPAQLLDLFDDDGGPDALQDRLAGWLSDLTCLHGHTERLARARGLDDVLTAVLESGAALLGAGRGLIAVTARGAGRPVGLGLDRSGIGALETVPVEHGPFAGLLGRPGGDPGRLLVGDLAQDPAVGPRFREVAGQLGLGACFALPLGTPEDGPLGAAAWFWDEPAEPSARTVRLVSRYCDFAAPLLAGHLARDRSGRAAEALRRSLLPDRLPTAPGARLAARILPARLENASASDWYDAIELPDGALAVTVGSVFGDGPGTGPASAPGAAAAMARVRAALRAYAVLEGEDPVSVLGDLELLLKTTEPARTATAAYAWIQPAERRIALAGAGHCPPILLGRTGAEFVETSLSAPLGVLSCWEAPGVELTAGRGDLLLLYTEGLARHCGPTLHAGQGALRRAAADAPRDVRLDPDRLCAHLLEAVGVPAEGTGTDDVVLLAVRFE